MFAFLVDPSAYVVTELGCIASRPTNAEIVLRLRDVDRDEGPTSGDIVQALGGSRR